jgi:RTX calcium-binding nonapeptide repeat (4 copies)
MDTAQAIAPEEKLPEADEESAPLEAQLSQAVPPDIPAEDDPAGGAQEDDTRSAAGAGSLEDTAGTSESEAVAPASTPGEQRSVLQEFLADGPPRLQEQDGTQQGEAARQRAPGDRRPLQLNEPQEQLQEGAATTPREGTPEADLGRGPPRETAVDAPVPDSGGASFYRDDFQGVNPDLPTTRAQAELGGDPILPDSVNPIFIEQFGDPLVLSSLAAVELTGPAMDVAVPPLNPILIEPTEVDPLTELQLAQESSGGTDDDDDGVTLIGTGVADNLDGTDGNDTLSGLAGDDTLDAGAGDDLLTGGTDNDTLSGGDGADVFSFSLAADAGDDTVTDFSPADGDVLQLIDLTDDNSDNVIDLQDIPAGSSVTGSPAGVDIAFSNGASISLQGFDGTGANSFASLDTTINLDVA